MPSSPKWIRFVLDVPIPARKTKVWIVATVEQGERLGTIRWHGPWRCYSFYPEPCTVFERQCLRDIADFCEGATYEHRQMKKELKHGPGTVS